MRIRAIAIVPLILWAATACAQGSDSERVAAVDVTRSDSGRITGDSAVMRADSLVRAGRYWHATRLLVRQLTRPDSASPAARLVGARAASGWQGWDEVERLLRTAPWLDSLYGGEGRELLARSGLARDKDARPDAQLALADARTPAARVTRRVLLARALDRANVLDSTAAAYASAAKQVPEIADWLRLRAAGAMADSGDRAAQFADITTPVARERVPWTDAQARERTGDFAGASRVYRSLGAIGSAFRVEALAAKDSASRLTLARRIVAYLGGRTSYGNARQAVGVLDGLAVPLTREEELTVARAAADNDLASRAVQGFTSAAKSAPLSQRDLYAYSGALMGAGRESDAAKQYALITEPSLAPRASYQRARALVRAGSGSAARSALRSTATRYSNVPSVAAPALLLLADLQVDDGNISGAARSLAEIGARYPSSSQAPLARFRAGLVAWQSSASRAASTFDTLFTRYPKDDEADAARYWAGRAYERMGRHAEAATRWKAIITGSPYSYYAWLASRRLKLNGWAPPTGADTSAHAAAVDSISARIAALQQLGMDAEARFELDALVDRASRAPAQAPAIAQALLAASEPARGLRVALRAIDRGTPTRALFIAAFPVVHEDALREESRRHDLDPALVAGLIRQESSFNPRAVSAVGARGLMQLMPSVGAAVAKSMSYPMWDPALLFDPDVSLELGTAHLASSLKRGVPTAHALAAYNAGASRVARWVKRPGSAGDPELFTEWIPYTETRDYVRIVLRNQQIYRALYRF
ncbi:MAG TPA: transglycosylase SLT domain-containing protein [Gemmatimonadaceae bacterium]|nr:transglycosylase SLT domain-containing protein [Gemmatimonadaceae bacterium]